MRISYDSMFVANGDITYHGKKVTGLQIYVDHIFRDKETGQEVLFMSSNDCPFPRVFALGYDKDEGFSVEKNLPYSSINTFYEFDFHIRESGACWIFYEDVEPETVSLTEAVEMLVKYQKQFDHKENRPAENTSWSMEYVDDKDKRATA